MESIPYPSQEELEQLLEKAMREHQALLEKMTPEEREQAQIKAQKLIAEDEAAVQKILESAEKVLGESAPQAAPKFCTSCGAPVSGGRFCTYCGSPL